MLKLPLLYVEWNDHWAAGEWYKADTKPDPLTLCKSVGWLYRETKDAIFLIGSACEETAQVGNIQCIGKGMVVKRAVLKSGASRKKGRSKTGCAPKQLPM